MKEEQYIFLRDIISEFAREAAETEEKIAYNQRCIREAEKEIRDLTDSETDDFKVFSPRKAENLYKEDLEKAREKMKGCKEENLRLGLRKDLLRGYMCRLEDMLGLLKHESDVQTEDAGGLREESIKNLENLADKISSAISCVELKPIQVKQDLAVIGRCLKETTDKMRGTVWLSRSPQI